MENNFLMNRPAARRLVFEMFHLISLRETYIIYCIFFLFLNHSLVHDQMGMTLVHFFLLFKGSAQLQQFFQDTI